LSECPSGLQILWDLDVIRYEIGYAAETGWQHKTGDADAIPPFDYVEALLLQRIANIKAILKTDCPFKGYLSEGKNFRHDVAKRKTYKGNRLEKKPYHYKNLTVYLRDVLGAEVVTGIEADDALAIAHSASGGKTIVVSRDKDLRQLEGWSYGWELGNQPSFGPNWITPRGSLILSENNQKLTGTGIAFFYAQVLMGDAVDNIPGCPGIGPVAAHLLLDDATPRHQLTAVKSAYKLKYGDKWEAELTEQGRLCWLLRKPDAPWEIGVTE
jgi:hypothetical protein